MNDEVQEEATKRKKIDYGNYNIYDVVSLHEKLTEYMDKNDGKWEGDEESNLLKFFAKMLEEINNSIIPNN